MCGIVGFTNTIGETADGILQKMMDSIYHRGPDAGGTFADDRVCLGVRRLGTADSKTVIFNEDNTKVLLFDGNISNHVALRDELGQKGHVFATDSACEVVLHGYEEYGQDIVNKLEGLFAFVVWDSTDGNIFGARDIYGGKPLYYFINNGAFVFASEIKALLAHPSAEKRLNLRALEQYLTFQYSPENETMFEGIFRLPAAHCFEYKDGKINLVRYYKFEFRPDYSRTFDECVELVDSAVRNAVRAHTENTPSLGAFLSSGIDSSLVSYLAGVKKTFTVGFESALYEEVGFAKEFSEFAGFENISRIISAEEFFNEFGKIQYIMDEPLADPSAVALYFLSELASSHARVTLSGEGADELFGGYNIYSEPFSVPLYNKIPFVLRHAIAKVAMLFPNVRGFNFLVRRGVKLEDRYIGNAFIFTKRERERLLKSPVFAPEPFELCRPYFNEVKGADDVTKMQYIDLYMWMAGDIMLKADRMTMAHSLEVRSPLLDRRVLDLALSLPVEYKVSKKETKICLRAVASKILPKKTAEKRKLGFPVPIRVWLRQQKFYELVKQEFTSSTAKRFFNTELLVKMLDRHFKGERDFSRKIWTVYTFLVWYRQYFE